MEQRKYSFSWWCGTIGGSALLLSITNALMGDLKGAIAFLSLAVLLLYLEQQSK